MEPIQRFNLLRFSLLAIHVLYRLYCRSEWRVLNGTFMPHDVAGETELCVQSPDFHSCYTVDNTPENAGWHDPPLVIRDSRSETNPWSSLS